MELEISVKSDSYMNPTLPFMLWIALVPHNDQSARKDRAREKANKNKSEISSN